MTRWILFFQIFCVACHAALAKNNHGNLQRCGKSTSVGNLKSLRRILHPSANGAKSNCREEEEVKFTSPEIAELQMPNSFSGPSRSFSSNGNRRQFQQQQNQQYQQHSYSWPPYQQQQPLLPQTYPRIPQPPSTLERRMENSKSLGSDSLTAPQLFGISFSMGISYDCLKYIRECLRFADLLWNTEASLNRPNTDDFNKVTVPITPPLTPNQMHKIKGYLKDSGLWSGHRCERKLFLDAIWTGKPPTKSCKSDDDAGAGGNGEPTDPVDYDEYDIHVGIYVP